MDFDRARETRLSLFLDKRERIVTRLREVEPELLELVNLETLDFWVRSAMSPESVVQILRGKIDA